MSNQPESSSMTTIQLRDQGNEKDSSPAWSLNGGDKGVSGSEEQILSSPNLTPDVRGWKLVLVISSILSSTYLFALDNSIVADIQPAIIKQFHSVERLPWLSVSYSLGASSTCLVWGKLWSLQCQMALHFLRLSLEVGSAICGAANMMDVLIFGRVLAGTGGVGLYAGVMSMLSVTTTLKERPLYIGFTGLVWGCGAVTGPIIGGALTDSSATWRWTFYINLVVAAVCAPIYFLLLPSHDPRPGVSLKSRWAEIDYAEIVLIVGAFISGIMGVAFGGIIYAWRSGRIIALLTLSGSLFSLLGIQQTYSIFTTYEHRLFPVQFLKSRSLLILFIQTASSGGSVFIPIYFIPLFFQFTRGDKALDAGVRLLPFLAMFVLFVILNGAIMTKEGHYKPWYVGGTMLMIVGTALMSRINENTSTSSIYGYAVITAIGAGSIFQASFSVAQALVPASDVQLAVAFINITQIAGISLALVLANSVFLNLAIHKISAILPPGTPLSTVQATITGSGSTIIQTFTEEVQRKILHAVIESMSKVYIFSLAGAAVGFVAALGMKWEKITMPATA